MTCEHVRTQLTGYLDGELDGDAGTMVRGHLRSCESCRGVAADEAALRDGLRSLPPIDAPNSLWAGVQARLAAEEVAESQRPAWRRVLARWMPAFGWRPIAGALVAATAVGMIVWKMREAEVEPQPIAKTIDVPMQKIVPDSPKPPTPATCETVAEAPDVTADVELDDKRVVAAYDCAVQELMREADRARADWSDTQRAAFDDKVRAMRQAIAKTEGKPRKRASSALVAYLQGAIAREQILVAGLP